MKFFLPFRVSIFVEDGIEKISVFSDFYPPLDLCRNTTWNESATTFANQSMVGLTPRALFIDRHDHIYVADHSNQSIVLWEWGNFHFQKRFNATLYEFSDLFVGMNGDIFFEHRNESGRIEKWSIDQNTTVLVAQFDGHCYGLFIDTNNTLYCSLHQQHKVMKISLDRNEGGKTVLVAGNGSGGSAPDQLDQPWGIFVDHEFNLFVADANNHRIQRFSRGEIKGRTVAGQGMPAGLGLKYPTDVMVDDKGSLYIADNHHHRVIRSSDEGWQCIAACHNRAGSAANELNHSLAIQVNSRGDLYVADEYNHRIQRFDLLDDGCSR